MLKKFFILLCVIFLSQITPSIASKLPDNGKPLVITWDGGGSVSEYLYTVEAARLTKTKIIIDGQCYSACTLYTRLAKDNLVCATYKGWFFFHQPTRQFFGRWIHEEDMTEVLEKYYPANVKEWLDKQGGLKNIPYESWWAIEADLLVPTCTKKDLKAAGR